MAEHITDNLWRLDIPLEGNPLKNLNSYLIVGERSLLIDTGFRWESCREAMERQLEEIGVDRNTMDIMVTHLHSDHAGLAPELIREGGMIYIGAIDGPGVEDYMDDDCWRNLYDAYVKEGISRNDVEHFWHENPAQRAAPLVWEPVTYLQEGDVLSYGGHDLKCILTPGHTPGHMCLYDEKNKWLFAGDHILFDISPNICRWGGMKDALGDYLESLQKVRDMEVDLLLPAHRAKVGSLPERVDELTRHHMRRIESAWQTVRDEPGMNAYQIAGKMRWKIRSRSWDEFPPAQKFFAVGEALAHLDYLEVRGRVERREENGKYCYYAINNTKERPDMELKDILSKCDHTLLSQTATWEEIKAICDDGMKYGCASVCIPASFVKQAAEYVEGKLPICTVIGFPNGYATTASKCFMASDAVDNGAAEVDMVINMGWVKDQKWDDLLAEIKAIKAACKGKLLKVIIECCFLTDAEKIKMCEIVTASGADFIKTSTGFGTGGATREDVALFAAHVGPHVKIKAAGGIADLKDAQDFIELGASRLGTSRVVKAVKAKEQNIAQDSATY